MSTPIDWVEVMDWGPSPTRKRTFSQYAQDNSESPGNAYQELITNGSDSTQPILHSTPAVANENKANEGDGTERPGLLRRFTTFVSKLVPSFFTLCARLRAPASQVEVEIAYVQKDTKRKRLPGAWPQPAIQSQSTTRRVVTPPSRRPPPHYTSANHAAVEAQLRREMEMRPHQATSTRGSAIPLSAPKTGAVDDTHVPGTFPLTPPSSPKLVTHPNVSPWQFPSTASPKSSSIKAPSFDDVSTSYRAKSYYPSYRHSNEKSSTQRDEDGWDIIDIREGRNSVMVATQPFRRLKYDRNDPANYPLHKPRPSTIQLSTDPLAMSIPQAVNKFAMKLSERPSVYKYPRPAISQLARPISRPPTKFMLYPTKSLRQKQHALTATRKPMTNRVTVTQLSDNSNNGDLLNGIAEETIIPMSAFPAVVEAVDEDLSYLPDAPEHQIRHVHFAKDGMKGAAKPSADKVKTYTLGEPIGHPVFPKDESAFDHPHTPKTPHDENLQTETPTTGHSTPGLISALEILESPAELRHPSTPDSLKQLQDEFANFEISKEAQQERDEKEAERQRLEDEAKARHKKEREEWERKEEEKYKQQAARLKALKEEKEAREAKEKLAEQKKKIEQRLKIVKDLPWEYEQDLDRKLAITDPAAPIIEDGLTRKDLATLLPQSRADGIGWLNDEVVNAYIGAIVSRILQVEGYTKQSSDIPSVHAFTTFLYTTYKKRGFQGIARWVERAKIGGERILGVRRIIIPINSGNHWTLLVISGTEKAIVYYDSLGGGGKQYIDFAKDFLAGVLKEHWKEAEWDIAGEAVSPQQQNGVDCGVFVCLNALATLVGREPELSFDHTDIPRARRMIGHVLSNGGYTYLYDL